MIDSKDGNKPFLGKYVVTIEDLIYELGQFLIEGLKFYVITGRINDKQMYKVYRDKSSYSRIRVAVD